MEKVSKFLSEGVVESAYYDVEYRPSQDSSNFDLNLACSNILGSLALADITRCEQQIKDVHDDFLKALSYCKTDEEIENLSTFLKIVSEVGGYASTFYLDVITLVNRENVEAAKKNLQEEKEKPVSKFIGKGTLESPYLNINCDISKEGSNSSLDSKCYTFLVSLACADVVRKEIQMKDAYEDFLKVLSLCSTSEDIVKFDNLLYEASSIGGYANKFYNENKAKINKRGVEDAKRALVEIEKNKKNPVSKIIPHGIESKYFEITYRPWEGLDKRNIACSHFLFELAMCDATNNEKYKEEAMLEFCKILISCKTDHDFSCLTTFIGIAANVGGYAIEFKNKVEEHINKYGIEYARLYIKDSEKKEEKDESHLAEFQENYDRLFWDLEEFRNASTKTEDDVEYFIRRFHNLSSDLYSLGKSVDKNYINECDDRIKVALSWLNDLYQTMDEVKRMFT